MTDAFREANRLWLTEGRTARALALYAEAAAASPTDPVVAFQLARALWAVDRFAEAKDALASAQAHRNKLSDLGQLALDQWQRLSAHDPDRHHLDLPADRLDRDRLHDFAGDWRRVAEAADERGMGGLAVYALERGGGVPIDAEDARDVDKILTNRDLEEALVRQLPASTEEGRTVMPLELEVRVDPAQAPVSAPMTVTAVLRNAAEEPQVVNHRLLLNSPGAAGEVWLELSGPESWRNRAGFRIRAGRAPAEFYVELGPGESVEHSWDLTEYATTDAAGEYELTLTYHNDEPQAPDGRPMAVGTVSGHASFERTG